MTSATSAAAGLHNLQPTVTAPQPRTQLPVQIVNPFFFLSFFLFFVVVVVLLLLLLLLLLFSGNQATHKKKS